VRRSNIPGRNGVEQGLRHAYELSVTNGMHSAPTRCARDDIEFANRIALAIFANDADLGSALGNGSQPSVDDYVEAIAGVVRAPQDLPCVDRHPVQRRIDMLDCVLCECVPY
jgi:hypothetical protein